MKKCPRCGADLSDGTTSFCPVCGKETENCEDCIKVSQSKKKEPKKKRNKSQRKQESKTEDIPEVMGEPVDDGYDGYYDDVLPPDLDRISEGLDKKLIKNIVTLGIGFVVIVGLCIALLCVL